jgi:hypothetical protein
LARVLYVPVVDQRALIKVIYRIERRLSQPPRTNTSLTPFVSSATRFVASELTTNRPSSLMVANPREPFGRTRARAEHRRAPRSRTNEAQQHP